MPSLAQKIKKVMQQGNCNAQEACEALGIDCDAAIMADLAESKQTVDIQQLIEDAKPKAVQVLVDIIEDSEAENKDKIAAAKIILVGSGELPNLGVNGYEDRFKKFLEAAEKHKIIDIVSAAVESDNTDIQHNNRLLAIPA